MRNLQTRGSTTRCPSTHDMDAGELASILQGLAMQPVVQHRLAAVGIRPVMLSRPRNGSRPSRSGTVRRIGYAIRELRSGRDIYDPSRHLGHASVKTTEIYLGHVPGGVAPKRSGVQSGVR